VRAATTVFERAAVRNERDELGGSDDVIYLPVRAFRIIVTIMLHVWAGHRWREIRRTFPAPIGIGAPAPQPVRQYAQVVRRAAEGSI
jgi:hypothetical protein